MPCLGVVAGQGHGCGKARRRDRSNRQTGTLRARCHIPADHPFDTACQSGEEARTGLILCLWASAGCRAWSATVQLLDLFIKT